MGGLELLGRTYRQLNRWRQVAFVLAKHGFGDLLRMLSLDRRLAAALERMPHPSVFDEASRPARVRRALAELGPTFIKAGQYLSTRADLLDPDYRLELAKLQDHAPPFSGKDARALVESELGAPIGRLFSRFSTRPTAAASLAQVHEAVLPDGTPVAVKVQRPDARALVAADLEIMSRLAASAERHSEEWRLRRPVEVIAQIARSLDRELDLSIEAAHVERFARQFANEHDLKAPKVHRALSSPRVLTLERVEGIKIDELEALERAGIDPRLVAERLARHYLAMIFTHGFFHADPHPGNLLIQPGPVIAYLDFGMMGRIDRSTRASLAAAALAVAQRDERALSRSLLRLAQYDEPPDFRAFEGDMAELMDEYAFRPLADWRLGRMFEQLFRASARHGVRVPGELFLLVKTLSELEELTRRLDPRFDAVAAASPFLRRTQEESRAPALVAEELAAAGRETLELLTSAPGELRELLRQARRGRLLIEFEHKGLEPALASLDQVSNRIAYAVLLAALVIGSSLLLHAGLPPLWRGVSALGLLGFGLSGAMALWLLSAILRHGKL